MGDSELLYVVLAILLFGGLSTSINKYLSLNNIESLRIEAEGRAISIAQEIIEDAKTRKFDENLTAPENGFSAKAAPTVFADPRKLTTESEQWPNIDDIDDYSGGWEDNQYKPLQRTVATDLGDFYVKTLVYYVAPDNLTGPSPKREYFKKLVVTVSNEYLEKPVTMEHVYAFWNLN